MSATELLREIDSQLLTLQTHVKDFSSLTGRERKAKQTRITKSISDIDSLFTAIKKCQAALTPAERTDATRKLRGRATLFRQLKTAFRNQELAGEPKSTSLTAIDRAEQAQAGQLGRAQASAERQGASLGRSEAMMEESKDIGQSILAELGRQANVVDHTMGTLGGMGSTLDRANAITGRMHRREQCRIVTCWLIFVIQVLLIAAIWYGKVTGITLADLFA
eukprot:gnl/Ergobibamus_cyprinoides/862.p1 GENE.gnl/Ergobibamus_cyprinoides/862~~gnl/Ergobibamus_cyprinoides/862.p1  ORF type:complete len:221 (+),score=28.05 gnl/Ergobibamus_cyprinoides/862:143-805(+)